MAKNNERNLNVTIKNRDDDKDQVIISIPAILKSLKKFFAIWLVAAIVAGLLTFCYSAYKAFSVSNPTNAMVSFTFDGIEKGLDPNGETFEIESMKNPKVIEMALTEKGLDLSKVEDIRTGISFGYKMPQDAYEQLQVYSSVMDQATGGSLTAAQAMLDTKYFPTQFTVTFDFSKAGFDRQTGVDFLNTLLRCYGQYFYEQYGYNEPLGAAINAVGYENYDYAQQVDLFRNSLRIVKNYLDKLSADDNTKFRSSVTGYTFNDIYEYADTVTSIDLDRISSYISVNNVTKDRDSALAYYDYRIENLNLEKDEYAERLASLEASIAQYKKDTIRVVGKTAENEESEETVYSEEYDNLFRQKTAVETQLAQTKQDINFYNSRREALKSNKSSSKANVDKVEADIKDLSEKVSKIVDLTEKTSSDYYENVKFVNAYKILVPATNSTKAGLSQALGDSLNSIIICECLIFAIYLAAAFISAFKFENRKKAARAGAKDDDDDDDAEEVDLEGLVDVIEEEAEKAEKQTNVKKNKKK